MKSVKLLLAALFVVVCSVSGQEKLSSDSTQLFFDDNGELTRIKVLPEDVPNTIISPNPRKDDIDRKSVV